MSMSSRGRAFAVSVLVFAVAFVVLAGSPTPPGEVADGRLTVRTRRPSVIGIGGGGVGSDPNRVTGSFGTIAGGTGDLSAAFARRVGPEGGMTAPDFSAYVTQT